MGRFGVREFQLCLIAMMPDSAPRTAALEALGAADDDAAAMLQIARALGLFGLQHSIDLEKAILGEELFREPAADVLSETLSGSEMLAFQLTVFAGFHYAVNVTTQGFVWGQRFIRRRDSVAPVITSIHDLQPWAFVKEDLAGSIRNETAVDGFSFSETIRGDMSFPGGAEEVIIRFDFDLLQAAEVADRG